MTFDIIHECTGVFAMIITVSSIIAYPAEKKQKILGILFVIPFIYLLNIIRLEALIYVGIYYNDLFDFVHSYLWQGTFIIFVILAWFLWIDLVVNHER
jgi:archaeosortase B (VPXXXP-CTERM-specific)